MRERHAAMKALTIRQPYASLVIEGTKDVENRTWYPGDEMIGERFAVHSSARPDTHALESFGHLLRGASPNGMVLGTVSLFAVVRDSASAWASAGNYHWLLAEPELFDEPVPMLGKLGLWILDLGGSAPT